jgi:chemotaxis family two-component system sensor kinase Cph1
MVGETVSDVVLQFRSLRMLIIQDQLEQIKMQIRPSEDLVIIADAKGDIVLTNEAFDQRTHASQVQLRNINELPALFLEPVEVREKLLDLVRLRRSWRGEVKFAAETESRTLMIRADPVLSAPGHVLGFVLMFIDVTERKAVEAARRRLQDGIIKSREIKSLRLGSDADVEYLGLISLLVGNAQRAAVEITDGIDLARVPEMLDSIRTSVTRTAELLGHLVWHAKNNPKRD